MSDARYVLDASALLAMLGREPGGDAVAMVLGASAISAVSWSDVRQRAQARGVDARLAPQHG